MSIPGSNPPEPPGLRLLRGLAGVALAVSVTFVLSLAVIALVPALQEIFRHTFVTGNAEKSNMHAVVLFVIVAMALAILLARLALGWAWRKLGIGGAGAVLVLGYLAADDTKLRRPVTLQEFSPVFPGAEASYQVMMRYGKNHPGGRDFRGSKLTWAAFDPQRPEPWIKFVTANRAAIEAEWRALKPARDWWAELNSFSRIGDLSTAEPSAEILAFRPVRELSQRGCAMATLLALDGRGDEAVAILWPLIEVARKIQVDSRALVHFMIAVVIERMSMQTAGLVLDRTAVAPAQRARLAAVLSAPGGGEAGARHFIVSDYVLTLSHYGDRPIGDLIETVEKVALLRSALNLISPFIYNRRATFNLYATFTTDVEDIVGRRQMDKLEPRVQRYFEEETRPGFKNLGGAMVANYIVPALGKVSVAYWKTQDERAALLQRSTAP